MGKVGPLMTIASPKFGKITFAKEDDQVNAADSWAMAAGGHYVIVVGSNPSLTVMIYNCL